MTTLSDIEAAAKSLSTERETLAGAVAELIDGIALLRRKALPLIKRRLARAAERQAELQALIAGAPSLFVRPRTVIFHGLRLGYEKGKGSVSYDDADRVVALIQRHLPDQFDVLVKTEKKPRKTAIALLPVNDAKRIGCSVQDAGDQVVIRPVDGEVDKMVDALLKDAVDVETAEREGAAA